VVVPLQKPGIINDNTHAVVLRQLGLGADKRKDRQDEMTVPIDISVLPAPAKRLLSEGAPKPPRMMAARGIMPGLKPADIVTVVAALTENEDAEVAAVAQATFGQLPPPMLNGALATDLDPGVADRLARAYIAHHDVMARVLQLPRLGDDTLVHCAEHANEKIGELIATNEQRMLACPQVIEKLYMNKKVRMSTSDRLIDLAVRNGVTLGIPAFKEAAEAIKNELIVQATEEPTYDDVLFQEVEQLANEVETKVGTDDLFVAGEDHNVAPQEVVVEDARPLYARINDMTVTEKIRAAMLGNSACRLLLVRDRNRLVAEAAAKSPMLTENDAARITASRVVGDEVLRIIATNRELVRNYQVKLNLVQNPRTPFTFAIRLIPQLRDNDVRLIARSKNVPSQVCTAAKRQLLRKAEGKR
jgi:hypothetical protein